jgi:hypothetical protein
MKSKKATKAKQGKKAKKKTVRKAAIRSVKNVKATRAVSRLAAEDSLEMETVAEQISNQIRDRHMPHGTLLDPIFASPESDEIVSYTHGGDSAIWTGHYLAAESFRHRVTRSTTALDNVRAAVAGIRSLVEITGGELLARAVFPPDSPWAEALKKEEGSHGIFEGSLNGRPLLWLGGTSRDQYSGVFFGLGVALEHVPEVREDVADLINRLAGYLVDRGWIVRMPDKISTIFHQRPDQQLAFLQIARKANPGRFSSRYNSMRLALSAAVVLPISYELLDDHHHYFKFNLNTINLYALIHHESDNSLFKRVYMRAYDVQWRTLDDHGNAHFNMIDRAIKGPNASRDARTVEMLKAWLKRPRRDPYVDLRGQFKACGEDRACEPIPVELRPTTDFLWQRSPFLLHAGGYGIVEEPGIDFILPYWMARFYGVL